MIWAALLVLASTAAAEPIHADTRGVEVASARVSVEILRPAIVRQSRGLEVGRADAPRPQINRRGGRVLVEFE